MNEAERHRAKMEKRKAVQDAEVAGKTIEKGLLMVHTGTGKGKSTAAFGLALRMIGRGHRVGVVQFIKGAWHSAERDALEKFGDQVVWHTMGEGFTWETQDRERDIAAATRAWAKAQEMMADPAFALIVHTGKGKGKSTAAWGLLLRAVGRGLRCGVVQFGKGAWQSGERTAVEKFGDQVEWHTLGEGFTWETQDRARDVAAAERAWAAAQQMMADPAIRLIVLDELNITLRYDHLDAASVITALQARRQDQHIVVTGRNAKPELIDAADLVTEMTPVKHHFAAGVKAQEGIEF